MKGFFVATAGNANFGLDGTMWTFDLKVPATAKVGDVKALVNGKWTTVTKADLKSIVSK